MTLTLKPCGRGNWKTVLLEFKGDREVLPMFFYVGDLIPMGGVTYRIYAVHT